MSQKLLLKQIEIFRTSVKDRKLTPAKVRVFQKIIYDYYHKHRRRLPWRRTRNPYNIVVSEIMLQQTQVRRVQQKYPEFIKAFPDFRTLAHASVKRVLSVWQGMGYNRRALLLRKTAHQILKTHKGKFPETADELIKLPGIGKTTASSILAFAFNKPVVFIETNIRTVFIHFFFREQKNIADKEILLLVEKTLDMKNPRMWYNALMDCGVMLKKHFPNPSRKSKHYAKQTPFEGSNRQVRGNILNVILKHPGQTPTELRKNIKADYTRIKENLEQLHKEGFIRQDRGRWKVVGDRQ